jgi:hypothetical protein
MPVLKLTVLRRDGRVRPDGRRNVWRRIYDFGLSLSRERAKIFSSKFHLPLGLCLLFLIIANNLKPLHSKNSKFSASVDHCPHHRDLSTSLICTFFVSLQRALSCLRKLWYSFRFMGVKSDMAKFLKGLVLGATCLSMSPGEEIQHNVIHITKSNETYIQSLTHVHLT